MKTVLIDGEPVYGAVLALRLLARDPQLVVGFDLGELPHAEAALLGFGTEQEPAPDWFAALATQIWDRFAIREGDALGYFDQAIALIDPLQCLAALSGRCVPPADLGPEPQRHMRLPARDRIVSPSLMVAADALSSLPAPLVYEPAQEPGCYRQYLPCGEGLVMVRHRCGTRDARGVAEYLARPGWRYEGIT